MDFSLNDILNTNDICCMEQADKELVELQKAVSRFIKTGYVTEQLKTFVHDMGKFYENYNDNLYIRKLIERHTSTCGDSKECYELEDIINKIVLINSYASSINFLYDLYNREKEIRDEQEEFKNIIEQCPGVLTIIKEVYNKNRVKIELGELEDKKLDAIEMSYEFLNIRCFDKYIEISLKQKGRRLHEYADTFGK